MSDLTIRSLERHGLKWIAVDDLIARLEAGVADYRRLIPAANSEFRKALLTQSADTLEAEMKDLKATLASVPVRSVRV